MTVAASGEWVAYLDALEAAVTILDGDLIDGHVPSSDVLASLTAPTSPPPPRLADRRALVLALLQDVTGRAQARRDAVAAELLAMPRRRAPAALDRSTTLGSTLDIVG